MQTWSIQSWKSIEYNLPHVLKNIKDPWIYGKKYISKLVKFIKYYIFKPKYITINKFLAKKKNYK